MIYIIPTKQADDTNVCAKLITVHNLLSWFNYHILQ